MFVFGGKSNGYHNDIWKFDLGTQSPTLPFCIHMGFQEDNSWEVMTVEKGSRVPARRYGHSGVLYSSEMFIFGGFDCDSFTCSDLWSFSFGNLSLWSPLNSGAYHSLTHAHSPSLNVNQIRTNGEGLNRRWILQQDSFILLLFLKASCNHTSFLILSFVYTYPLTYQILTGGYLEGMERKDLSMIFGPSTSVPIFHLPI